MMLGDKVSSTEAERLGMIYKNFSDETFSDESMKIAYTLAQMPTKGLAFTKHALNYSLSNSLESQLLTEDDLQRKAANTEDYKEGVDAFLQKRPAIFKGK